MPNRKPGFQNENPVDAYDTLSISFKSEYYPRGYFSNIFDMSGIVGVYTSS